jgi:hypothetical protein
MTYNVATFTVASFVLGLTVPVMSSAQVAPETAPAPIITKRYVYPPKSRIISTTFQPWSRPTPTQVRQIIAMEAARYGAPLAGLVRRISCESGMRWWAKNGQYLGLGQFATSTFYRGMSTIKSRVVRLVKRRERAKRVLRIDNLADGTVRASWRWPIRQRVIHVYHGVIPRRPPVTHGWAQIRIMAQALVGRSAVHNSEWECRA